MSQVTRKQKARDRRTQIAKDGVTLRDNRIDENAIVEFQALRCEVYAGKNEQEI